MGKRVTSVLLAAEKLFQTSLWEEKVHETTFITFRHWRADRFLSASIPQATPQCWRLWFHLHEALPVGLSVSYSLGIILTNFSKLTSAKASGYILSAVRLALTSTSVFTHHYNSCYEWWTIFVSVLFSISICCFAISTYTFLNHSFFFFTCIDPCVCLNVHTCRSPLVWPPKKRKNGPVIYKHRSR